MFNSFNKAADVLELALRSILAVAGAEFCITGFCGWPPEEALNFGTCTELEKGSCGRIPCSLSMVESVYLSLRTVVPIKSLQT